MGARYQPDQDCRSLPFLSTLSREEKMVREGGRGGGRRGRRRGGGEGEAERKGRSRESSFSSSLKASNLSGNVVLHLHILTASQTLHLLIPTHWRLEFQ